MKNVMLVFSTVFLFTVMACAQTPTPTIGTVEAPETVTVCSVTGIVKFSESRGAKEVLVRPGDQISKEGRIRIVSGGSIGLCDGDAFGYNDKSGAFEVTDMITTADFWEESDVTEVFNAAVNRAIHPYFSQIKRTKSGFVTTTTSTTDTSKPPSKKERDGHGDPNFQIVRIAPMSGKVYGSAITFKWAIAKGDIAFSKFVFNLYDRTGKKIHSAETTGMSYTVDAKANGIVPGKYSWEVKDKENQEVKSPKTDFEFVGGREVGKAEIMATLSKDGAYQKADPVTKLLMEASFSEHMEYPVEAGSKYELAHNLFKNNVLARKMYYEHLYTYDLEKDPQPTFSEE